MLSSKPRWKQGLCSYLCTKRFKFNDQTDMRSRTLIICCLLPLHLIAQTHRIDSTRNELPHQTGKFLVDSYNALANEFSFYWIHSDSAFRYSDLAIQNAEA